MYSFLTTIGIRLLVHRHILDAYSLINSPTSYNWGLSFFGGKSNFLLGACLPFIFLPISKKQRCAKTLLRGVFQPQILDASSIGSTRLYYLLCFLEIALKAKNESDIDCLK
ncbi:hypothetical protein D0T50_07110 [Bacteroides sp. 214]|nr:hypothetical protein [Bacteroides sp. 214]